MPIRHSGKEIVKALTGTEDYFLGSYNFWMNGAYQTFTTPYSGLTQAIIPDGSDPNVTQARFGMYRWHLTDPVRFRADLRVTMQALGWRSGGRALAAAGQHLQRGILVSDAANGAIPCLA